MLPHCLAKAQKINIEVKISCKIVLVPIQLFRCLEDSLNCNKGNSMAEESHGVWLLDAVPSTIARKVNFHRLCTAQLTAAFPCVWQSEEIILALSGETLYPQNANLCNVNLKIFFLGSAVIEKKVAGLLFTLTSFPTALRRKNTHNNKSRKHYK